MISESHAQRIFDCVMSNAGPGRTVAYLMGGKEALTRFAKNSIHQNVLKKDYYLKVIVERNGRVGMTTSNIFTNDNIRAMVRQAEEIASMQKKESKLWFNPEIADYLRINLYDIGVFEMTPEDRAVAVKEMADIAREAGQELAGAYSVADWISAVACDNGFFGYHIETHCDLTVTALHDDGRAGWGEEHAHRVAGIDHRRAARQAVEKVTMAAKKHAIGAGAYDVILEHPAVTSLLGFLVHLGCGAQSVQEGTGWLAGRIGEKLAGDNFTLIEDCLNPGTAGRTFDYQGVPRQKVVLFDKGVATACVHDLETAEKDGVATTGHGNPHPSSYGPMAFNLHLEGGDSSIEEMIRNTERGIYVTHFHYDNVVDPKIPTLTGMTRDGTFLIENGEIVGSIGNLRYNESVLDAFSRIESLSKDRRVFFDWGKMQVPAMKIKDFHFTGGTGGA